jgi:uncharacterized protein
MVGNLGCAPLKRKHFFISFAPPARHNQSVTIATGALLNAVGILLGGFWGLAWNKPIPLRTQIFLRNILGASAVFFGLRLVWSSVERPHLVPSLKQLGAALVAVILGNAMGHIFGLQKSSNRLGKYAGDLIASAQKNTPAQTANGFNACTVLFCFAPLGIIGAVTDGLSGYFWLLAIKAVMDGLAMASFVKIFRWPAMLSAIPVFVLFGVLALATRLYLRPFLSSGDLTGSINAVNGLITCAVALVIFEVRKAELANYLPCLVLAPLFSWMFK